MLPSSESLTSEIILPRPVVKAAYRMMKLMKEREQFRMEFWHIDGVWYLVGLDTGKFEKLE
jgi:hypothetical protein